MWQVRSGEEEEEEEEEEEDDEDEDEDEGDNEENIIDKEDDYAMNEPIVERNAAVIKRRNHVLSKSFRTLASKKTYAALMNDSFFQSPSSDDSLKPNIKSITHHRPPSSSPSHRLHYSTLPSSHSSSLHLSSFPRSPLVFDDGGHDEDEDDEMKSSLKVRLKRTQSEELKNSWELLPSPSLPSSLPHDDDDDNGGGDDDNNNGGGDDGDDDRIGGDGDKETVILRIEKKEVEIKKMMCGNHRYQRIKKSSSSSSSSPSIITNPSLSSTDHRSDRSFLLLRDDRQLGMSKSHTAIHIPTSQLNLPSHDDRDHDHDQDQDREEKEEKSGNVKLRIGKHKRHGRRNEQRSHMKDKEEQIFLSMFHKINSFSSVLIFDDLTSQCIQQSSSSSSSITTDITYDKQDADDDDGDDHDGERSMKKRILQSSMQLMKKRMKMMRKRMRKNEEDSKQAVMIRGGRIEHLFLWIIDSNNVLDLENFLFLFRDFLSPLSFFHLLSSWYPFPPTPLMMNDEWWVMNDEWWMMNDEW
jgi:hypothetical protein